MNESAILALIGELYAQIANLTAENTHLREQLTSAAPTSAGAEL